MLLDRRQKSVKGESVSTFSIQGKKPQKIIFIAKGVTHLAPHQRIKFIFESVFPLKSEKFQ